VEAILTGRVAEKLAEVVEDTVRLAAPRPFRASPSDAASNVVCYGDYAQLSF
jgi:hypothetical protein